MRGSVVGFFDEAERWRDRRDTDTDTDSDGHAERGATPPRLAIRGEASLGKSGVTLEEIRARLLAGWRILFLVPTIPLADALAARARQDAGIENVAVIRGRSQPNPERPGETMCAKADIAEQIAALGYNVTETLCQDKAGNACEHQAGCAYFQQLQERKKGAGLLIGSHAYLALAMEMLKEERIDLVVIDESFWQTMVRGTTVPIDRFKTPRRPDSAHRSYAPRKGESRDNAAQRFFDDSEEFRFIQDKAIAAINAAEAEGRQVTLADFRAAHLSAGDCGFAAGIEYTRLGKAEIHPGMTTAVQREALERAVQREAFALARFWKLLAAELETKRDGPLQSVRLKVGHINRAGTLENAILMDYSADARFQRVPVLMIDADADPVIVERFYPGARFKEIAAEWTGVRVRQVMDRTGSKLAFSNPANRERVRTIALDLADQLRDRIGDPSQRPLVVAQKHVEDAWQEAGHRYDYDGGIPEPDAPFQVAHFGNIRGKDHWKNTAALIVVGRIEPSPQEVGRLARAVFFKSPEAVVEIVPNEKGQIILPRRNVTMTARDGSQATVSVSFHPDDRADRILRQIREAELSQTLARVRPVHRAEDRPCEILVLTNIPLNVVPDTFATWSQVVPDRIRQMELRGFVPDLSTDVADAYPDLFDSPAAVRQAARRAAAKRDEAYIGSFYEGCHTFPEMVRIEFRREGNRRRRQAWAGARPGETAETVAQRVRAALPDAFAVEVVGVLPDPVERPQAAEDALFELVVYVEEIERVGLQIWWRPPLRSPASSSRRFEPRLPWQELPPDPGRGAVLKYC